jgi:chromosomal replication initiation ATPase DnaA
MAFWKEEHELNVMPDKGMRVAIHLEESKKDKRITYLEKQVEHLNLLLNRKNRPVKKERTDLTREDLLQEVEKWKKRYRALHLQTIGIDQSITNVINEVATFYGLNPVFVDLVTRKREIVWARQICGYILTHNGVTQALVGKVFGGKDHSTINHGNLVVTDAIDTGEITKEELELIERLSIKTEKFIGAEI